ncbi:MAG: hypothetical protein ACWA6R_10985 [Nitrosomonas sp.]
MNLYMTLQTIAQLSFEFGAIDFSEYCERIAVAKWIADQSNRVGDPRGSINEEGSNFDEDYFLDNLDVEIFFRQTNEYDWLELVVLGNWYFTGSDPDSYPSVPHGHLHSANRPWPKLNPYTGRVFAAKHKEDISLRLKRRQMQELWRSVAFRDFCRSQVMRYIENFPFHEFGVRNKLRFPRW